MFCVKCGTSIPEIAQFCPECGESVQQMLEAQHAAEGMLQRKRMQLPPAGGMTQGAPAYGKAQKKKNKKKGKRGLVIALVTVLLAAGIGLFAVFGLPVVRYHRQIDLGNRYLSELQYDEAVTAFEDAIAIDPKRVDAYEGLASVYSDQDDFDAVAATYVRASDELDESALSELSASLDEMTLAWAEEKQEEKQYEEAIQALDIVSSVTESEVLIDKGDEIYEELVSETLVWEQDLYDTITEGLYLEDDAETFQGYDPSREQPIAFALLDMDEEPDGIPELIVFNGSDTYAGSFNMVYQLTDDGYRYVDGYVGSSFYNFHQVAEDRTFPGLFDTGAHTGYYWTRYYTIDANGKLKTETIVAYSDERTSEAGEFTLDETERTADDALYNYFMERMGGTYIHGASREDLPHALRYVTLDDISEMGWENFLRAFGFRSVLFRENPLERERSAPALSMAVPLDMLPENGGSLVAFAEGLYQSLPTGSYTGSEEIMQYVGGTTTAMESFLFFYGETGGTTLENYAFGGFSMGSKMISVEEASRQFSNLLGVSYDFTRLAGDVNTYADSFTLGTLYGSFYQSGAIYTVKFGFDMNTHGEFAGYETHGNVTYMTMRQVSELSPEGSASREIGGIILELQRADNDYGYRIAGCQVIKPAPGVY